MQDPFDHWWEEEHQDIRAEENEVDDYDLFKDVDEW